MTFRELKAAIAELSDAQLDCEVNMVSINGEVEPIYETRFLEELPACIQDEVADLVEPEVEC